MKHFKHCLREVKNEKHENKIGSEILLTFAMSKGK